jgi:hypothetical protein
MRIRYFTARTSARPNDPQGPVRQETYLRALGTLINPASGLEPAKVETAVSAVVRSLAQRPEVGVTPLGR